MPALGRYETARLAHDPAAAELRDDVRELLEKAPLDALDKLPDDLPPAVEAIGPAIEEGRENLDDLSAPLLKLRQAQEALETLTVRARRRRGVMQVLKLASLILSSGLIGYLLSVWFRFHDAPYVANEGVLWPLNVYEARGDGALAISSASDTLFWREFPRYYFARGGGAFERTFVGDGKRPFALKLVMRNPRNADPLLVSSIEASAHWSARPFPWSRVDVTPKIETELAGDAVILKDAGLGPAVHLRTAVIAAGFTLQTSKRDLLYHDNETVSLRWASGDFSAATVSDGEIHDLYRPLAGDEPSPAPEALVQCGPEGPRFERVTTAARLRQVAPIVLAVPARVDYSYESLRGEHLSGSVATKLPDDILFYRSGSIRSSNPCELTAAFLPRNTDQIRELLPPALIDKLAPGASAVKGADMVVSRVEVPMGEMDDGEIAAAASTPDEIVNPGGFLVVYVNLLAPKNGDADVDVRVNGTVVRRLRIPILAPDELRFDRTKLDAELKRFR